jgi:hypothetical protein
MGLVRASFIHLPQIKINMNNKLLKMDFTIPLIIIILLCAVLASCRPVSFANCNHMPTKLRCTAIKFNGKQCLNKAVSKSKLCKHHLDVFYPANK